MKGSKTRNAHHLEERSDSDGLKGRKLKWEIEAEINWVMDNMGRGNTSFADS